MSAYLVINRIEDLNIENFRVGLPRNRKYSIIRYMDPRDKARKQLYLQTPGIHLGNLSLPPITNENANNGSEKRETPPNTHTGNTITPKFDTQTGQELHDKRYRVTSVDVNEHNAYLDLYLHKNKEEFRTIINEIDMYFLKKIWTMREEWGLNKDMCLNELERYWISSIQISTLDFDRKLFEICNSS